MYIINIMNIPRNRIYRVRCVRFILRILFFHVILLKYRQDLKDTDKQTTEEIIYENYSE